MDYSDSHSASSDDDAIDYDFYDNFGDHEPDTILAEASSIKNDPEYVEFNCLDLFQVKSLFDKSMNELINSISVPPSWAKLLLYLNGWNTEQIVKEFSENPDALLVKNFIRAERSTRKRPRVTSINSKNNNSISFNSRGNSKECSICCDDNAKNLISLDCLHYFCQSCWTAYLDSQLFNGASVKISCMASDCRLICLEDFVMYILSDNDRLRGKYELASFREFVYSHPFLRWCPGVDCNIVIFSMTTKAHRATCSSCNTGFCIKCGADYHAPASCEIIKKWMVKCADDSETANYISAHTKDCPNCHSCIEKNGGCNHMQCAKCKHHFCWMCFRDWKTHGSEYYECSRYKENPSVAQEANNVKARRALEKYLHYFERFENHAKSLKMEEELRRKIKQKIDYKVSHHQGTWIDWQYLHDAASLLTKCRYTLQYTYPFAYYMETDARKELFEYQQAQLEKEIEELSWKVERAETTDRGDLESQMHIAELKRRTLLQDFFA
uniref:RBR-type E3 ubiquitin transferase n=1 Tax=Acrobeloides nanus TaxID=290746 RepID=A0A914EBJ1_9BILA